MKNTFSPLKQVFVCCAVAFFLPNLKAQQTVVAPTLLADKNNTGRNTSFGCCGRLTVAPPSKGGIQARNTAPVPTEKAVFGGVRPGSEAEIRVLDATGAMVNGSSWSVSNTSGVMSVDLSKLADANYFIQVKAGSQVEIYNLGGVGLPPQLVTRWTVSDDPPPRHHWCKSKGDFVDSCSDCDGPCDSFISVHAERGDVTELPKKGPLKTPEIDKTALLAIIKDLGPKETTFKLAVDKNGRPTRITKLVDCPVGGFLFQFRRDDK